MDGDVRASHSEGGSCVIRVYSRFKNGLHPIGFIGWFTELKADSDPACPAPFSWRNVRHDTLETDVAVSAHVRRDAP